MTEIKPHYDLWRNRVGLTRKALANLLARHNACRPKRSPRRKVFGLFRVEKKDATLLAKIAAATMAAAVKELAIVGQIEVASIRRKQIGVEGGFYCQLV